MPTSLDSQVKDYLFNREKVPDGHKLVFCQKCGLFYPKKRVYDGTAQSVLCDMCMARMAPAAYLLCASCGKFLGVYKPGRVKLESGVVVEVEPGDTLHTQWCPDCNQSESSAEIVEFRDIMLQKHLEAPKKPIVDSSGKELKVEGV